MTEIFGDIDSRNTAAPFENRIRLAEGPIDLTWQHASVTAEFLGDVYGMRSGAQRLNDNEARHSVGYLVNELLENAVKFRAPGDVLIESSLDGNRFEVRVSNYITEETAQRFQPLLAEITEGDPGELLIQRIEANAGDAFSSGSGLGLLTLMSDYGARLGWRFSRPSAGALVFLEVFAALDLT